MELPTMLTDNLAGILLSLSFLGMLGMLVWQAGLTYALRARLQNLHQSRAELEAQVAGHLAELSRIDARLAQEIAERKQAEHALWMSQFSLDKTADGVTWMTQDGQQIYVNDAACRIPGFTREELLALTVFDLDPTLSSAEWQRRWQHYKQQGSMTYERLYHRKDGHSFPVDVTMTYLEFQGKEYLCSFFRDISERKGAEAALRESEEHHRNVVERGNDGIFILQNDAIAYINPQMAAMLGYVPDEIKGVTFDCFIAVEDKSKVYEDYRRRIAGEPAPDHYEIGLIHKDGYRVAVELIEPSP